ncbi:hypothetical protein DITRI_Ditri05aG0117800 [Diplodiscus trichospermus]
MDIVKKRKATVPWMMVMMMVMFFLVFSADSQHNNKKKSTLPKTANDGRSTVLLPLYGNVYPIGHYSISLRVGHPPKEFEFDIDTGSDLTWVQCDAPCTGCTKPVDRLYKPKKHLLVRCEHPSCGAVYSPGNPKCVTPSNQCDFFVEYADRGSVLCVLVNDFFSLKLINGSTIDQRLIFGCGYDLKNPGPYPLPPTDGVVGLGSNKGGILSQLHSFGITRNVLGHCLSGKGGGYLFIGDDLVPSGIGWMPLSADSKEYFPSRAELLFGGKPTGIKDLKVAFDSGASYTYFSSHVYEAIVDLVSRDLNGKPLQRVKDTSLPICWKGNKPFKSVDDVKKYFSTLTLKFTNTRNIQLQIQPEAYLIVTQHGNACLGVLNSKAVGLEINVIGDVSMLDKLVVYDHEKQQIGWASANCDKLPKS